MGAEQSLQLPAVMISVLPPLPPLHRDQIQQLPMGAEQSLHLPAVKISVLPPPSPLHRDQIPQVSYDIPSYQY